MRSFFPVLTLFLGVALAQDANSPRDLINQGVQAFKNGRYSEAAQVFQRAADLNPADVTARLYLATSLMSLYVPGERSAQNQDFAQSAEREFQRVLEMEPRNRNALSSMATLRYQEAMPIVNLDERSRALDEAASWNRKMIAADPGNKDAFYTLGVIAWSQVYPRVNSARAQLGMRPEDPGPLTNAGLRYALKLEYGPRIDEGLLNLERALQIDPKYADAMAYTNLLHRLRADLSESPEEYHLDIAKANQWVEKSLEAKSAAGDAGVMRAPIGGAGLGPQRIRVVANVQSANLIAQVPPVYPPLAKQARIQGTVRFMAIIDRQGHIANLQLVSGHPLLVSAAKDAVGQWQYKPTLLNGNPVEVVTDIDVSFTLSQ